MKPLRLVLSVGAMSAATLALAACGGIPSDAVVQVGGTPVTKSTFEHWLTIAAARESATASGQQATKPVIPDPPAYNACIAHLEATAPKRAKGQSKPTAATFKTECEQQYTALKSEALGFLIQANWLIGEAKEQGVSVSDKEVEKQFETLKHQTYPKEEEFQKYLATTSQTVSDLLLQVKINMLGQKLEQKVTKNVKKTPSEAEVAKYYEEHKSQFRSTGKAHTQQPLSAVKATVKQTIAASSQQKSLSAFIKEFQKSWKAKTECRSEYLVADCKSYKALKPH